MPHTLGLVRKLAALGHTALKIGSKYSFTPRKLHLFADFCLVWPSLADFSDKSLVCGIGCVASTVTTGEAP
ncbi:hypothetical protein HOP51_14950 [Halomonas sp. MCCC 1A11036]|uniref:Uncharacterized protein n=1 Tax=Billgrantia zhangzhouensis TaxID=2733481 RepID=A0ABS9AIA2_9GAMM|nr:hypothetical protein [Halomonas zhangzhouensis]MCE8021397.1 hypothetical protein [Halomonas zhangzhouensis]